MGTSVLIAGATGSVGSQALRLALDRGYRVTALARNAERLRETAHRVIPFDATQGIPELAGQDVVISALGAPIAFAHKDRRAFRAVDFAGNVNLLKAAKRAGVSRFIYVSVHVEIGYAGTSYVRAHEEFVNVAAIVRPRSHHHPAHGNFQRVSRLHSHGAQRRDDGVGQRRRKNKSGASIRCR